jgi:DNA gyrase/topoisomerase IV subunit A
MNMNIDQITGHDLYTYAKELKKLCDEIAHLTQIVEEQKAEIKRLYIELDDPHQP